MKKLLALLFTAFILSSAAFAQKERPVEQKPRMERHNERHEKDKMMKDLNLTKEQKVQLKSQHQDMNAKREALKAQGNITVKEMREKQKALKAEQKMKVESLLTADQKIKMAEMKKHKMAERDEKKMKRSEK